MDFKSTGRTDAYNSPVRERVITSPRKFPTVKSETEAEEETPVIGIIYFALDDEIIQVTTMIDGKKIISRHASPANS